jgi:hypothetical protein
MKKINIFLLIGIIVFTVGALWVHKLNLAHSTFERYSAFRGCTELVEKTETYGMCKTKSGAEIKMVLIDGNWYLEGDGPGIW